ncbi:MAG: ATP-dependent sacrificial sulfur transferase LarE [Oscillospiraceae bacterium]|nr:ATP-dependent sacrificial sulfur transferase LarE [Oscillospiraceae bacterium]
MTAAEKQRHLLDWLREQGRVAVAFSGGVDSAYLLWAAAESGAAVTAYYVSTAFQPAFEGEDARRLCAQLGVTLRTVEVDVLSRPEVTENSPRRCYFCKKRLFTAMQSAAATDGCTVLCDGTNASDDAADRPGMVALRELQVASPLREAGLTKGEIRALSRQAGLFTWDKPAYACLATRIPTGTAITAADLQRTERAENDLASLGFREFRVRLFSGAARIHLRENQFPLFMQHRQAIVTTLRQWYDAVLLDGEVRP